MAAAEVGVVVPGAGVQSQVEHALHRGGRQWHWLPHAHVHGLQEREALLHLLRPLLLLLLLLQEREAAAAEAKIKHVAAVVVAAVVAEH